MKLNITAEEIATIQTMSLAVAREYALTILDNHSTHEKAVREKDPMKFVRLRQNIMGKQSAAAIMKMFYDMYLAGEGLGVKGSKWKRHYNNYA